MKPTNEHFRKIFDTAAPSYDALGNPYTRARRIEFVLAHARGKCLEVGAGTGEISRALSVDHEVEATDISPKMVEEIRRKGISAVVCDAEQLPFPASSFDTVIAAEVIYYLDHPERFLAEAYRILRPDGRLVLISATAASGFYGKVRSLLRTLGFSGMYFDDHMHHFPRTRFLRELITAAGFTIERTERFIIVPFGLFERLNRILERTPMKNLAAFAGFCAVRN